MQPLLLLMRLKAQLTLPRLLSKLPTARAKPLQTLKLLLKKQPTPLKKRRTLLRKQNQLNQLLAKQHRQKHLPSSLLLSKVV